MGLGIDLETAAAAAAAEPFHATKAADPHRHAASGGRRGCCSRASCSSPSADDDPSFLLVLVWAGGGTLFAALAMAAMFKLLYPTPSYSVHLTGYEGIDPGRAARIVSPAFNVTLRMNGTCVDTALVAVTYSDVALGWARAEPRDCAEGRWAKDLEVVARGGEVGLSRRLRDHMASDWRSGEVELGVTVMMYRLGWRTVTENIPRTFDGKVKMTREGGRSHERLS
ncbi:hypothetical protein C2845_PM08G26870 [Panicum miliaceum]|uniref:Late embryogenesis abundant protein LEA-2 subgroup domain-containing protein n=1 Tax=Panicum miliaceum TaxID=4540 RepID=A0A3L6QY16_PANMI|nr:hypothetical protein C2845_PM08G26870 [Panicum miliaceum]